MVASKFLYAQVDTIQKVIPGRKNNLLQQSKPYVILISADGFRYDYAVKYNATTLLSLSSNGIRAESMIPTFPSLTFPNHYSIVTGLYPSHHGIVDNSYYDRSRQDMYTISNRQVVTDGKRYGGNPLWVLAEQQQMLTASFYWVGSEADIKGIFPTYHYNYNEDITIDRRIQVVTDWLNLPADVRPHLITFYFPEVDHDGHTFGPQSSQTAASVRKLDSSINLLTQAVKSTGLPVNFIFVSDHGMTDVDTNNSILIAPLIDTMRFIHNRGSQLLQLYAKSKKDIRPAFKMLKNEKKGYNVYLNNKIPKHFIYRRKDDWYNRIGDIILIPEWPKVFTYSNRKKSPGAHGYDPYLVKDMHATFYAWEPAFKENLRIHSFENIHIYPVITKILGLNYKEKIDGKVMVARKILK